jgi:hypothetical protein
MDEERPQAERSAGMFLGPTGTFPAAIASRSDELRDAPPEPADPAMPPAPPRRRSLLDRLLGRNPPPPRER